MDMKINATLLNKGTFKQTKKRTDERIQKHIN